MDLKESIDCDNFYGLRNLLNSGETIEESKSKQRRQDLFAETIQYETKLLNIDRALAFENSLKTKEEIEQENDYFLLENFDQLFGDIWENNEFDKKNVEKLRTEIENRFLNIDDLRDSCQGYIDDHRLKSKIFLKMIEIINFKVTGLFFNDKPQTIIDLSGAKLVTKLDDTFFNINCVTIDNEEDDVEKYTAGLDMEEILELIKKIKREKKDLYNFLENYHFDLKNKINYFYQTLKSFCKKPLDISFEPQTKLTEKELEYMLDCFGFGKYMLDVVEFNNAKKSEIEKQNIISEETKDEETKPKVEPISPDDEKIRRIGNNNGKIYFCFQTPDLLAKKPE